MLNDADWWWCWCCDAMQNQELYTWERTIVPGMTFLEVNNHSAKIWLLSGVGTEKNPFVTFCINQYFWWGGVGKAPQCSCWITSPGALNHNANHNSCSSLVDLGATMCTQVVIRPGTNRVHKLLILQKIQKKCLIIRITRFLDACATINMLLEDCYKCVVSNINVNQIALIPPIF